MGGLAFSRIPLEGDTIIGTDRLGLPVRFSDLSFPARAALLAGWDRALGAMPGTMPTLDSPGMAWTLRRLHSEAQKEGL